MQHISLSSLSLPFSSPPHPPALFSSLPSLPPAPSLSCRPQQRMCLGEGKGGKQSLEWICALSPPPFLLLICPPSPSSASAAPWAPSAPALGEKEACPAYGQQKTELQCQQEIRGMVVTNQEVMHTKRSCCLCE